MMKESAIYISSNIILLWFCGKITCRTSSYPTSFGAKCPSVETVLLGFM